jgi:hypothetical protein
VNPAGENESLGLLAPWTEAACNQHLIQAPGHGIVLLVTET